MKLTPYDPAWPDRFEQERACLVAELGDLALRIEHVGSTSVPGLQAKPIIDIQISVEQIDIPLYEDRLRKLGYRHFPVDPPFGEVYPFFHKPARWPTSHHIHICQLGSEQETLHLAFRNWLRTHPEDRDAYGALKDQLAQDVDESDVDAVFAYTQRKGNWIQAVTKKAVEAGAHTLEFPL